MSGRFRLTKSKFQIFSILPFSPNSSFLPNFGFFRGQWCFLARWSSAVPKFYCSSKFWQSFSAGIGAGNLTGAGAGHTKNFRIFQILASVFSWKSWDCFNLNCPKFPNFGKAGNFFQKEKNFKKLENSGGTEICRVRTNKPYIPKKSSFFSLSIRSGPAQIFSFN